MAYPTIYPLNYSYTGFQQAQGNNSFPGTQLDADLHGLRDSVSALALFTGGIIRSDGRLKNGVVTRDSLAPALQTAGIAPANAWTSATSYAVDIAVVHNSNLYRALVAHTSGVFATDLAVGKWVLVSALIGNDQAITPEQFRLAIDADWTNAFQRLASHVNTYGGCRVECGQNVVYNIWSAGSTPTTLMVFNNVQGLTINSNSARFTTDNLFAGFETPRLVFFRGSSGIINGLDFEQTGLTTLQSQKGAVLFEIGDHSGGPSSSNVILNNIRQFGGTQGITVAPGQPYALRSAARIEVNNAEFDTVFYPQLFQGAGEQYTARGVSTKYAGRSYFSEGSGQHDVDMVSQGSASGNADCVIVSYARPLNIEERNSNSSIKLRYRNLGRVADTISEACVVLAMRQTVAPVSITAAANNGSGKTRLTVDSAADMATGQEWFFSSATGTTAINGKHVVTKIDATHIDLLDVTYVANSPAGNVRVPVTIKNIDLDFEVSSSDGYQQPPLLLTYKNKHDLSIDDSGVPCGYTIENLSIRGTAKGYNNGTRALDLFSNDYGSLSTGHSYGVWTGETIRNVSVNGLTLEGTSSDVKIDATDITNLELINIVSASGITWTVTDPNVVAYRRNVIATGLTDPVRGFFKNAPTTYEFGFSGTSGTARFWNDTAGSRVDVRPPNGAIGNVNITWPGISGTVVTEAGAATLTNKGINAANNTISGLTTPMFAANVIDTDGTLAANSDTRVPTQKAVRTAINALIGANDVETYKGVIDCSANPNYPAADAGHVYRVSVAGKIGGASGTNVEIGDRLQCITDGTAAGTQAAVGSNWWITQTNIDGAVIGPVSATDSLPAVFDGATGKLIKSIAYSAFKTLLALVKGDVGLGNVDNTSDANKPVSTLQAAADAQRMLTVKKQFIVVSGTYTPSAGMVFCIARAVPGGGGGAGAESTSTAHCMIGGGGGAGSPAEALLTAAQIGASKAVTIGAAGAGGVGAANGTAGTDTSLGALLVAKGGSPGTFSKSGVQHGQPGAGGVAGTGDLTAQTGNPGQGGGYSTAGVAYFSSGAGGNSIWGGGGKNGDAFAPGNGAAGSGYGSGGAGAIAAGVVAAYNGGAGAPGALAIWEFCTQ